MNNIRLKIIDKLHKKNILQWYILTQKSQYWTKSEWENYQTERLQLLIEHAYSNVIYYRRLFDSLGLTPKDIQNKGDLVKIPLLTKRIIRDNYYDLIDRNALIKGIKIYQTGGTTGDPLKYVSDDNSWSLHWALKYRAWEWGGYEIGNPIGVMGGASIIPNKTPNVRVKIWNKINGFCQIPASHLTSEMMKEYYHTIKRKKIQFLRGYPSSIAQFANFCSANKMDLNILAVITTAEVLQEVYKQSIKSAFNCTIIDTYGCADGDANANTCQFDNGFHVSLESGIWEICDEKGNLVNENEIGEVTLTSLTNYAMPFIRYQPGDLVENYFDETPCQCGCTLPRVKRIMGRTTDVIRFPDGRMLGGPALTLLFARFPLIKYQIVQHSSFELEIKVIPDTHFTSDNKNDILKVMQHHCGQNVSLTFSIVEDIPLPLSGKHKFIISNYPSFDIKYEK